MDLLLFAVIFALALGGFLILYLLFDERSSWKIFYDADHAEMAVGSVL